MAPSAARALAQHARRFRTIKGGRNWMKQRRARVVNKSLKKRSKRSRRRRSTARRTRCVTFWNVDSSDCVSPYVSLANPTAAIDGMQDGDEIVLTTQRMTLVIDYPLTHVYEATIESDSPAGFTRKEVAELVSTHYQKIYAEEARTSSLREETYADRGGSMLLNRAPTNGTYGIMNHFLSDLMLHSASYDASDGTLCVDIDS